MYALILGALQGRDKAGAEETLVTGLAIGAIYFFVGILMGLGLEWLSMFVPALSGITAQTEVIMALIFGVLGFVLAVLNAFVGHLIGRLARYIEDEI
ncbi:MAG: hypothetical protein ACOCQD_01865 [archaeon]